MTKKRKTIRMSITLRAIPLVFAVVLALVAAAGALLSYEMNRLTKTNLKSNSEAFAEEISAWWGSVLGKVESTGLALRSADLTDDDVHDILMGSKDVDESTPAGYYLGDTKLAKEPNENGMPYRYIDCSGWAPEKDWVPSERPWFKDAMAAKGELVTGAPYLDDESGSFVISASMNTKDNEVLAIDIFLSVLSDKLNARAGTEGSSTYLVDSNTTEILAAKNMKLISQKLTSTDDSVLKEVKLSDGVTKGTVYEFKADGSSWVLASEPVADTNWVVLSLTPKSVVAKTVNKAVTVAIVVGFAAATLFAIFLYYLIRKYTKPLKDINGAIEQIYDGDFSTEVVVSGNNEITTLCEKLNDYIGSTRDMMRNLTSISATLQSNSEQSSEASNLLSQSSDVQAGSMDSMNTTMNDFSTTTEDIANGATNLAQSSQELFSKGRMAGELMQEVVGITTTGKQAMSSVTTNMQALESTVKNLNDSMIEMKASTKKIDEITQAISEIASQTNLLALNASIEAARAGDAGRGFSVVATEIGSLANQSAEAVQNINELVLGITQSIESASEQANQSAADMEVSMNLVAETDSAFEEIYSKVETTESAITDVVESIKEVDDVATSMAAVTEEQSASTQLVLETTQKLLKEAQTVKEESSRISTISDDLSENSESIAQALSHYKI